ncbi:MAG TPA: hypothetical protein VMT52_16395 [Planctomycetota bacterium]|nr:hypothetical protein [Planctomycetota bacterium]
MSLSRRIRAAFFVLVYALTGGAAGSGVLCFGSDGHVTVEAAGSLCCQGEGSNADRGGLDAQATFLAGGQGAGGCGECTDVPLLDVTTLLARSFKLQTKDLAAAFLSFPCEPGILPAANLAALSPKRLDSTFRCDGILSHLRTVVLRR